ncbi:MAG TPA: hypothetical protein PLK90_08375 [Clostridiales bacterium]|nr:hypothetical protein [Clostridiales bacterium]HQP70397.1 hypothetical protein [Clostridiales bacterium]
MDTLLSGIDTIDSGLEGFSLGEMVISASRPGHGNIYLLLSIVRGIYYDFIDRYKCLVFSNSEKSRLKPLQPGDEDIFIYYKFQSDSLTGFFSELEDQIKLNDTKILIIDYNETSFQKNKNFFIGLKNIAVRKNILIFIKSYLTRQSARKSWFNPQIADIEGAPVVEKIADKYIIMHRLDVLGIKDASGRDQTNIVDIRLCARDLCHTGSKYIYFNSDKNIFENFTPLHNRYGYYYLYSEN